MRLVDRSMASSVPQLLASSMLAARGLIGRCHFGQSGSACGSQFTMPHGGQRRLSADNSVLQRLASEWPTPFGRGHDRTIPTLVVRIRAIHPAMHALLDVTSSARWAHRSVTGHLSLSRPVIPATGHRPRPMKLLVLPPDPIMVFSSASCIVALFFDMASGHLGARGSSASGFWGP